MVETVGAPNDGTEGGTLVLVGVGSWRTGMNVVGEGGTEVGAGGRTGGTGDDVTVGTGARVTSGGAGVSVTGTIAPGLVGGGGSTIPGGAVGDGATVPPPTATTAVA